MFNFHLVVAGRDMDTDNRSATMYARRFKAPSVHHTFEKNLFLRLWKPLSNINLIDLKDHDFFVFHDVRILDLLWTRSLSGVLALTAFKWNAGEVNGGLFWYKCVKGLLLKSKRHQWPFCHYTSEIETCSHKSSN